jgi:hypothetical protein
MENKTITYQDIEKANASLSAVDIKGKEYIDVSNRVKAFRMCYPGGCIETEMVSNENGLCIFRAKIFNEDGKLIATGTAYEKESSSFINKTSYIENCETSAVGRALGMAGFGIDTSIASANEVLNAIANQNTPTKAQTQSKQNTPARSKVLSEDQIKALYEVSEKAGYSAARLVALVKAKYKCDPEYLTKAEYDHVYGSLNKK